MSDNEGIDLAFCTEYHQALGVRVPRIAHGTVLALATLLGSALLWAGLTQADLVVRAEGRVRPVGSIQKVFAPARGEASGASVGGRVVEVRYRQGDVVRRGDVLLRLDSERVDNEIVRQKRTIQAGEDDLAQLGRLQTLRKLQFEAARARAQAELTQASEEVQQAKARHAQDVRLAQIDVGSAREAYERVRKLEFNHAASQEERTKLRARLSEAEARLERAKLPVEESRLDVLRRGLVVMEKDDAVGRQELALKCAARQAEVDAARSQLVSLELEQKQAVLRAPSDGIVTSPEVKVGDVLEPGKVAVEIAEQNGFRFEALVPSEEVGRLRVGMPVRVKLDAFDYQHYGCLEGTVSFISPDSGVTDGQGATVYLVRIDLASDELERDGLHGQVKLGMAGQAEIINGRQSILSLLARKIRQSVSLS